MNKAFIPLVKSVGRRTGEAYSESYIVSGFITGKLSPNDNRWRVAT